MSLQVTGKNIEVGESYKDYVGEKLDTAIEKYVGRHLTAHVRVEKERGRFLTDCSVRLKSGLMLEASGEGADAYASADAAFQHLEKRLRRHKRRLKSRHHGSSSLRAAPEEQVNDFVVALADEAAEDAGSAIEAAEQPLVVAETERPVREVAVSEAVLQLDLTEEAFLVFRNASTGGINVVYRRKDGHIGWIDPGSAADGRLDGRTSTGSALNGAKGTGGKA